LEQPVQVIPFQLFASKVSQTFYFFKWSFKLDLKNGALGQKNYYI